MSSVLNYVRRTRSALRTLRSAAEGTVRDRWIAQHLPTRPRVIQLPINDICNSQCVMCDIWKRKRDTEITAGELARILRDPLFEDVRYVGISGGEPTLRSDLAEIGQALVDSLPRLGGFGIITNGVREGLAVDRNLALASVARRASKSFTTMVSLDGIGEDHDRNRGVSGNFDSATRVIARLRAEGVTVGIGCTLTPVNCYGADDLLEWCESGAVDFWEFRLGVEIKRIYNAGYTAGNPLTPEQRFHVITFFDKLAAHPRVDATHRTFYRSLVGQMAFGHRRTAGCDWRSNGVTLDTRGNLSYCSVQSPVLESALTESATTIYERNLPIRREIVRTKCDSCQHDLIGTPAFGTALNELSTTVTAPIASRVRRVRDARRSVPREGVITTPERERPSQWRHVMITGWYGTETAGDKAILAEVVSFVRARSPECRLTITTLDRKVSDQTNRELSELSNADVVALERATDAVDACDAVILGGGPLEEIPALDLMRRLFVAANRRRKARIVFGCGVGPLYTDGLRRTVGELLRLSSAGFVRDEESLELGTSLGGNPALAVACDPALGYLTRRRDDFGASAASAEPRIAGLLRANTSEYVNDMSADELRGANTEAARGMAGFLEASASAIGAKVSLLPMHAHWVGGDDRIFNRAVAREFADRSRVDADRRYLPMDHLLAELRKADVAVAMRYHGHLFCMALGIPFLSIDYTGRNGKVASLLRRMGYERWSEDWRAMDSERAAKRLRDVYEARACHAAELRAKTDTLVADLSSTYRTVFGE